jgi:hypothetical protein
MGRPIMTRIICAACLVAVLPLLGVAQDKAPKPPKDPEFQDLYINTQKDGKAHETAGFLRFETARFVVGLLRPAKKDQPDPSVEWSYDTITGADYSYSKAPHYAAGILVSPFFLFTSGKAHWLTVKAKSDEYVILHLDKGTYRIILAELEKRTHIKVVTLAEAK